MYPVKTTLHWSEHERKFPQNGEDEQTETRKATLPNSSKILLEI